MSSEFVKKRHQKPDYEAKIHITGVRLGKTGVINWQVTVSEDYDPLLIAQVFEKAVIVLRGGGENQERPDDSKWWF